MYIPYNSRRTYHKSVFGALRQSENVTFNIVLPRDLCCKGVFLVIRKDDEKYEDAARYSFSWARMEGYSEEWWTLDYTPENTGLYMYHFECVTDWGTHFITCAGGGIGRLSSEGPDFEVTVYSCDFHTPDWLKGGVIYQIFPDRFYYSGEKKDLPEGKVFRSDWGGEPYWEPTEEGKVLNNDFFGGDLKGIEMKLDYLKKMGVSCIYLNPIFEASSNHRYDTGDYSKIDCALGDEKDFQRLCKKAEKQGIAVILDGVFSHTGDDSLYFNKYGKYDSVGAYQSKESPYYSWYKFEEFPEKYKSWWGIDILPEVKEEEESYLEFITGEKGIAGKWLKCGAKGWRLDVADELPDEFLDAFRKAVKRENPDALILGEVWEDASNKCSYGERRRYLQGGQLDSVMNYPFADAIIDFVRTGVAEGFTERIMKILEHYPKCVSDVLMNHIGTHDTARLITRLAGEDCEYRDRVWQSKKHLTQQEHRKGVKLVKLAALMQFTLPGVPSVYYGDEAGMEGYKDPFNRFCYPWGDENKTLLNRYRQLGSFRKEHTCFKEGEFIPFSEQEGCIAYIRKDENEEVMVIVNRNNHEITYYLNEEKQKGEVFFDGKKTEGGVIIPAVAGCCIVNRKEDK